MTKQRMGWILVLVVGVVLVALVLRRQPEPDAIPDVAPAEEVAADSPEVEPVLHQPERTQLFEPGPQHREIRMIDETRVRDDIPVPGDPDWPIGQIPGPEILRDPEPLPQPRGIPEPEPFDHEEHQAALLQLAPVHHARMAEARDAREAQAAREQELLAADDALAEKAERLAELESAIPGADPFERHNVIAARDAQRAALEELFAADAEWVALKEEADGADQRRDNVRQELVRRIQNRMRHDFAVQRAERDQALLEQAEQAEGNL